MTLREAISVVRFTTRVNVREDKKLVASSIIGIGNYVEDFKDFLDCKVLSLRPIDHLTIEVEIIERRYINND